jgi:hypothetical protein
MAGVPFTVRRMLAIEGDGCVVGVGVGVGVGCGVALGLADGVAVGGDVCGEREPVPPLQAASRSADANAAANNGHAPRVIIGVLLVRRVDPRTVIVR